MFLFFSQPRDQFIAKLIKKLKIDSSNETKEPEVNVEEEVNEEAEEGTWEDLASDDDLWDASEDDEEQEEQTTITQPKSSKGRYFDRNAACKKFQQRQRSGGYKSLLEIRQQLPVYEYRDEILKAVGRENVLVVAGETGSGKSTQIPQYIVEVSSPLI